MRKVDFLSAEKISERPCFVNKYTYFCHPPKVGSANQAFRPIRAQYRSVKK